MYKLTLLFVMLAIIGCQSITSSDEPVLGEEFEIAIGDQVFLDNRELRIEFKEVPEDSRCPEGVTCVWAGNAQVVLILNDSTVNLNTYLEPMKTNASGYLVTLVAVSPYPVYEQVIKKEEYVARLLVERVEN